MIFMDCGPYENPLKAQRRMADTLEEFLKQIQNIVSTGGYQFLIRKSRLEKANSLVLNQTLAKAQNFVMSGIIQLREEIHSHVGQNQADLYAGLQRFFEIFLEYQHALNQDIKSLEAQIALKQSSQENCNIRENLQELSNNIPYKLSKI